ncbi:Os05g0478600 [Oryza sativa Japonica Group]|uniref:Os05g0478600 protein n=1 Tax=Oryza sativa subsp. japonica TaxID=39947 RepID=A0A0P0WNL3_ORYSJ|nr:Os05g0478600 [Oryza sativa Japonica Group]
MASPAPIAPPDLAGVTTAARRWGSVRPATGSVDAGAFGRWQVACSSRAVSSAMTASGRRRLVRLAGGARPGADCRVVLAGGSRPAAAFAGCGDGASILLFL